MFYFLGNGKHEMDDAPMGILLFNARDDTSPIHTLLVNWS